MNVGWIGLGKIGAPIAAALAREGEHVVYGHDLRGVDPTTYDWDGRPPVELVESVDDVVVKTDEVVYVAVQTPHAPRYGGEVITPDEPRDFEYGYLRQVVHEVCAAAALRRKHITLVITSTIAPGAFDRELRGLLNAHVTAVYHPFLVALGAVARDFLNPEFTLYGVDRAEDVLPVLSLYDPIATVRRAPPVIVSFASAELAKMAYNTFTGLKIAFANEMAQLAEATGADVDDVTDVIELATDRLISSRYLRAGVGDGGPCHPRDNVVLSGLARRHGATDLMGFVARAREEHARWLVAIASDWRELTKLPLVLLGKSYKPGVPHVDGSPALLMAELLRLAEVPFAHYDPLVAGAGDWVTLHDCVTTPKVYLLATQHLEFAKLDYAPGSVVVDPFGYVEAPAGVTLITPGRRATS